MSFRITTNGTLRTYRSNLMTSRRRLNDSMIKVQTHRNFTTFAEDPAAASRAFQIRRSMWRADAQITNNKTVIDSFETAFSALDDICDGTMETNDGGLNGIVESLRGITDTTASARRALGQSMLAKAESIVKTMNVTYGDNFVFAGADGLNVPFSWAENADGTKTLLYRGVDVNAEDDTASKDLLDKMAAEKTYVDIGLGFQEIETATGDKAEMMDSSAFNSALSGLNFLGYGRDEDGDPNNIILLMEELGNMFQQCDPDTGEYPEPSAENAERANVLTNKIIDAVGRVSEQHVKLSANTDYLNNNLEQLENTKDMMDAQREGIEAIDPADAIVQMSWAQYCYNASLKIGNSILSQSLIDYMS